MAVEGNDDGQSTSSEETPDVGSMSREELSAVARGEKVEETSEADEKAAGTEGEEKNEEGLDEGAEGDESSEGDGHKEEGEEEGNDNAELLARIEKQNERLEQQSKLLDKFGTEVGLLRKTSPEEEKARLDEIREAYLEDPIEGDRLLQAYREEQKATETQSRNDELAGIFDSNRSVVTSSVKDFEENLDSNVSEIAEIMKADGASAETLEAFKENPYVIEGSTLFALHKRNQVAKELVSVKEQLAESEKIIAELKKKPGAVLDSIEKASRTKPLTGKDGSKSSGGAEQSTKPVTNLSRAELKKIANGG